MPDFKEPTPHPVIPLPSREWMAERAAQPGGVEEIAALLAKREKAILQMKADPYNYGYEPDIWKECDMLLDGTHPLVDEPVDELLILGGNRSGKSEYCAKKVCKVMASGPEKQVAALHSSAAMSIAQQQERVYRYLPPEYKTIGKGSKYDTTTNVQFTLANGFTNQKFILPERQTCYFWNYLQDVTVMEGPEYDLGWGDELIPLSYVQAIRYRLVTRNGKFLISFTPVKGYTQTVASFVAGAVVIRSEKSPILDPDRVYVKGCPPGHMPRVLRCMADNKTKRNAAIICFWTCDNPFGGAARMIKTLEGKSDEEKMIRYHGWAKKAVQSDFAYFSEKAHAISRARFRELEKKGGSRYCSCDPAGAKPWVIKWYLVTPDEEVILYREWPTAQEFGRWAKPGDKLKFDYDEGMITAPRYGINGYKRLIWELEGAVWDHESKQWDRSRQEKILMRFMDPRFGGKISPSAEDGTSIIELMEDDEKGKDGVLYPPMEWERAPASRVSETVEMLNTLMEYDEDKPIDATNAPKWYVVSDLENSIYAYKEFTELAGEKCALKDFVDPDRYFVKSGWLYLADEDMAPRGGGAW